ncbi:DUF423 domain-containing protein [Aestuariicella hydrocarbonica]|uniref:DUF423 domain-containing protein n=1 Tax=Pseudomaricurvus hydrocarbonicus TaxID=1470433 RepID=A0A9E5MPK0_9GAMM|nr:DUF423 domain-containing protein [Aestuariicella hydrocarbonica]NHO67987.1 DUF423 domain-containing protein [Aestuariicella hydrocarbonica]
MAKHFLFLAGLSGLLAVAIGAFGAHGLKSKIDAEMLVVFQTGVQYHFYHTFALAVVALVLFKFPQASIFHWAGFAFLLGMLLFSGSLYAMALGGPRWLGLVTPLGGLSFMVGWLCLLLGASRLT